MDHISVDHDKIAHGQIAVFHTNRRHDHDRYKTTCDQESLAEVQESQGISRFQRRHFIALHGFVIAFRLTCFRAKIFHGFKVQQAVYRLLVCVRILVIHLFADLHAPFSDLESEPDVNRDGAHDDRQIPDVEHRPEDQRDKDQFNDQRTDGKQQEAQQELHTLHTPFDNPGQAAGFAGDVIAHGKLVDMLKCAQGKHPQGALSNPGKDHIAQLLEADVHQPGNAVSDGQPHRANRQKPGRTAILCREGIHRSLVKKGGADGDNFGQKQHDHRQYHPAFHPALPFWPEIRHNPTDCRPAPGQVFRCGQFAPCCHIAHMSFSAADGLL